MEKAIPEELKFLHPTLLNKDNHSSGVYSCEKCESDNHEEYYKKGSLGFCKAPFPHGEVEYAHVWECQECYSVWWHHVLWDMIEMSILERIKGQ